MNDTRRNSIWIWPCLILLIGFVNLIRTRYGVDYTDEPYFIALIDWMTKGVRPFVDIWAIHQTSAILFVPVHAVFRLLLGGNTGIVLAYRILFTVLQTLISLYCFRTLQNTLYSSYQAGIISVMFAVVCPLAIPSINYNTLALLLVELILILLIEEHVTRAKSCSMGVLCALLVQTNPMMIITLPVVVALYTKKMQDENAVRYLGISIGGGLAVLLLFLCICWFLGTSPLDIISNISYVLSGTHGTKEGPLQPLQALNYYLGPLGFILLCILIVFAVGNRIFDEYRHKECGRKIRAVTTLLSAALFCLWVIKCSLMLESDPIKVYIPGYILFFAAICCLTVSLTYRWSFAIAASFAFGIAAFLGAQMGTDQSLQISGYFTLPVITGFVMLLSVNKERNSEKNRAQRNIKGATVKACERVLSTYVFGLIVLASCFGSCELSRLVAVYRDHDIPYLTETISTGPAAGLNTSSEHAGRYYRLYKDVKRAEKRGSTIAVMSYYPLAYLSVDMKPLCYTPGRTQISSSRLTKWYGVHDWEKPDVVVVCTDPSLTFQLFNSSDRGGYLGESITSDSYTVQEDWAHASIYIKK